MRGSLAVTNAVRRTLFGILATLLLLALVVVIAGLVFLDRDGWISARRLSGALHSARKVVLVEYSGDLEIARRTATADEISRLRNATSVWPRPFFPTAYLCFIPHHRIEIVRADGSEVTSEVCFLCEKFAIDNGPPGAPLPPYLGKSLASFFTSVGMAPKTHDEYSTIEIFARQLQREKTTNLTE